MDWKNIIMKAAGSSGEMKEMLKNGSEVGKKKKKRCVGDKFCPVLHVLSTI